MLKPLLNGKSLPANCASPLSRSMSEGRSGLPELRQGFSHTDSIVLKLYPRQLTDQLHCLRANPSSPGLTLIFFPLVGNKSILPVPETSPDAGTTRKSKTFNNIMS